MSRASVEVVLDAREGYPAWREQARRLIAAAVPPEATHWRERSATADLFAGDGSALPTVRRAILVPRAFPPLAERVVCHRDPGRYTLLYRLLWRLQSERALLEIASDPDVCLARQMGKAVRRDAHKMKAFVRFRRVLDGGGEAYVAWFEPEHHIVELVAPFFMRRFTGMRWSVLTPDRSAHWDGRELSYGPGAMRADCPDGDALEAYWRTYYASIFNAARLKPDAMRAEMPRKYWRNLPEGSLIPALIRDGRRAQATPPPGTLPSASKARQWITLRVDTDKPPADLDALAAALERCRRCAIGARATQAVPGEGRAAAEIMLVGEQPGDHEDLSGRPFVGPAGRVLDQALEAAGIDRGRVFVTNAVKHFKYRLRGKRRLHDKPSAEEIDHCRWWLGLELSFVQPKTVIALGATAARSLFGRPMPVKASRGAPVPLDDGTPVWITVHPSYLLRLQDEVAKRREMERFIADLRAAADSGR